MFGSGKKDDDAGAGRPRGGRAPRRRFDPELIPYGVGLLVFLLVLVVYLTSVGDADAEVSPEPPDIPTSEEDGEAPSGS